jgi:redox-sensitive bicupin YhaK (pirin superfamily)
MRYAYHMTYREAARELRGIVTMDGAGVKLVRLAGRAETGILDPFLLLDCFGSEREEDYLPGFPWHPHRGIETMTFMLSGSVRHGDSLGNSGVIGPGDVQWMTAGSGIVHEEMPEPSPRGLRGFQLWINLPRAEKMCDPAYRGIAADSIPVVALRDGEIRPIAGAFDGSVGPASDIPGESSLADLRLMPEGSALLEARRDLTCFACVYEGALTSPTVAAGPEGRPVLVLFEAGRGDAVRLAAGRDGCSLLFARGRPLGEPIAWRGPIVMNDESELDLAFREYANGTFARKGGASRR